MIENVIILVKIDDKFHQCLIQKETEDLILDLIIQKEGSIKLNEEHISTIELINYGNK
jgi:hypothetical protein